MHQGICGLPMTGLSPSTRATWSALEYTAPWPGGLWSAGGLRDTLRETFKVKASTTYRRASPGVVPMDDAGASPEDPNRPPPMKTGTRRCPAHKQDTDQDTDRQAVKKTDQRSAPSDAHDGGPCPLRHLERAGPSVFGLGYREPAGTSLLGPGWSPASGHEASTTCRSGRVPVSAHRSRSAQTVCPPSLLPWMPSARASLETARRPRPCSAIA